VLLRQSAEETSSGKFVLFYLPNGSAYVLWKTYVNETLIGPMTANEEFIM
jgi:hypothetical protein